MKTFLRDPLGLVFTATLVGTFYFLIAGTFPGSRDDALILIGCTIGLGMSALIAGTALAVRSIKKRAQLSPKDSNPVQ